LCERFTNQQDRIKSIIEIAKKERNNLCEDIEELFYLILGMKDAIHEELTNYLSVILEELLLEKNQETNAIDDLKRVCPNCCNKLPTISEINQQFIEQSNIKNTTDKPLVVCSYRFKELDVQGSVLKLIGYSESETQEPRTRPGFTGESSRYRARIRKTQFVNPKANNRVFQDISGEQKISEEMKRFSEIANIKRIEFIKAKLINKTALEIWHPIPITCEEADCQKTESSLTKSQLSSIINSLIPSLGDSDRPRFRGLSSKSRNDLINILREIRSVVAENSINIG
ncbi:12466_t:CDS:2, partial [Racocetra fulgida]